MSNALFPTGTVNTLVTVWAMLSRLHGTFNIQYGVNGLFSKSIW